MADSFLHKSIYPVGKFEGVNFSVWKAKFEAYLTAIDKEYVLSGTKPRRRLKGTEDEITKRESEIEKFDDDDKVVKSILLLSLADKYCMIVQNQPSAALMWERLKLTQEQKTSEALVTIQRSFFNLRLREEEGVEAYIARGEELYNRASEAGIRGISPETLVNTLLAGLPKAYHTFVTSFTNQAKKDLPDLVSRLCHEEELQNKYNKKPKVDEALSAEGSKGRKNKGGRGRGSWGRGRGYKGQGDRDSKKGCYICHEEGHNFYDCAKYDPDYKAKKEKEKKRKDQNDKKDNDKEKDMSKKDSARKEDDGMVAEEANFSCSAVSGGWIIDTGASSHMTYDRDEYIEYQELEEARVIRFAGSQKGFGVGIGKVKIIAIVNGYKKEETLNDVLHVPGLRRKLFSLSAAMKRGCRGEFINDKIVIRGSNDLVKLVARRTNNLYFADIDCSECNVAHELECDSQEEPSNNEGITLWHQRMGHINDRYLTKTSQAVIGMGELSLDRNKNLHDKIKCQACCIGKQTKKSIPLRQTPKASEIGQRLHVDIGGPVGATTISGGKYYILFKDEFTNYRFIFIMKSREEAHDNVKKVVAMIMADTKMNVRYAVSDSGSEFTSKRSQDYFLEKSIVHIKSAPFNPAQNGFIERENRTLMNSVRSILYNKNVSVTMWGEAAATVVYLLKR